MNRSSLSRRAAVAAACLGATAAVGAAPAYAALPGQDIYGSGSSLQKLAEQNVWTTTWHSTAADHSGLTNDPFATYTSTSSGGGLDEFGNNTGSLDTSKDATANALSPSQLDAWIGTDDPPTNANLSNASTAATGSASTAINEVTVPAAQAPVAVLLSLPTSLQVGGSTRINLTNAELQSIYDANVPAAGGYSAQTWGALLSGAGLTKVSGTPGTNQFKDTGGGATGITLQVRSSSSGTSYTFKGFLNLSGDSNYTTAFVVDDDTWPVATTNTGNASGGNLIANTTANPGSVGYVNFGDAANASPAYTSVATTTSTGGSHQILYAGIQDNQGGSGGAQYAVPRLSAGKANVYTGANINVNEANTSFVGHWTVPISGGTETPTGSWGGTQASDPDVYDHSGAITKYYPIVAVTYVVGWTTYSEAGSNLVSQYGGSASQASAAGSTAHSLLAYIANQGQGDVYNGNLYYAKLPSKIDSYALHAVGAIHH